METLLLALPPLEDKKPSGQGMDFTTFLIPMLLLVVLMLFMPLLSKKERTRQKRLQGLKKHDRVVTSGGLFGTVIAFDDQVATLEVAKGVRLTFKRSSIYDIEKQGEGGPPAEIAEKQPGAKG